MTDRSCPLCGDKLDTPMRVEVCGSCYQDMRSGGSIAVQATGEFHAMSLKDAEVVLAPPRPRSVTREPGTACSWCGKPRDQVKKILSGQNAHICNECVALCSDIMEAEVGPDWRR
jgi:hypothetical protein